MYVIVFLVSLQYYKSLKKKNMKKLLNNTILRNLQDYKLINRNTNAVLYLPTNQVQQFLKMNGGKLHNYKFETPEQRKAAKICNICDYIAVSCALIGITIVSYHFITL